MYHTHISQQLMKNYAMSLEGRNGQFMRGLNKRKENFKIM